MSATAAGPRAEYTSGLTILHGEVDIADDIDLGREFDNRLRVDEQHADALAEDMDSERGQLEEIQVVRRPGHKDAVYDGRHRLLGARRRGSPRKLRAAVLVGPVTAKALFLFETVLNGRHTNPTPYELVWPPSAWSGSSV